MVFIHHDHNKMFELLKFHSGYGKCNVNSLEGYSLNIINTQTVLVTARLIKQSAPVNFG